MSLAMLVFATSNSYVLDMHHDFLS